MIYSCCDELRRNALRGTTLNGIDYLEVLDHDAPTQQQRQRTLYVHFINNLASPQLTSTNVQISGGERIQNISVTGVSTGTGTEANILTVTLDKYGDYSPYTLSIIQDQQHPQPPQGYDPILSHIQFSFKVECPADFDCQPTRICPPEISEAPEINYLAKDYETFRQLMLGRMTFLMPKWKESHAADLGVALVELLAYVGDHLSYWQDAIGTEAYLDTARRRISMRRHVRLVDYFVQDGCNARAWVYLQVSADTGPLQPGTQFYTRIPGQPTRLPNDPTILNQAQVGFEPMSDSFTKTLYVQHNEIQFYTWGNQRCCLTMGTTCATLNGNLSHLMEGDVLIFEEVLGPRTGQPEDADPTHRCAVRLTQVTYLDPNSNPLTDPLSGQQITEIEWHPNDALPFPLCISSKTDDGQYLDKVSVARGNIVLADHGLSVDSEPDPFTVPDSTLAYPIPPGTDRCQEQQPTAILPRYRPQLKDKPLTHAAPYDLTDPTDPTLPSSAASAMRWNVADAVPAISLRSTLDGNATGWQPVYDLLNSSASDPMFVVETEVDTTSYLRFGDDQNGLRPEQGSQVTAHYRIGNGTAGNVGAGALRHILTNLTEIVAVRNPLPAQGGVEQETIEDIRQRAPSAFLVQERAVTPDDYAEVTDLQPEVKEADATFRWTGSWHTVFLTVDRDASKPVDASFASNIESEIERYRMAGYDLDVNAPIFVSLEIDMTVCVNSEYFRADVEEALLEVFSNRVLPNGQRGVFYPDNFNFGETVYLSALYAAAQAVPGVDSVVITKFQRQGQNDAPPDTSALDEGKLELDRLEIARLDNDSNYPEHGVFRLTMEGGK
jgi:hypothetical protein